MMVVQKMKISDIYPDVLMEDTEHEFKSNIFYDSTKWKSYNKICKEYRDTHDTPKTKELQSVGILTADGYAKTGFLMFMDDDNAHDVSIHCRLWKGKDKSGYNLDRKFFQNSISENFLSSMDFLEKIPGPVSVNYPTEVEKISVPIQKKH